MTRPAGERFRDTLKDGNDHEVSATLARDKQDLWYRHDLHYGTRYFWYDDPYWGFRGYCD